MSTNCLVTKLKAAVDNSNLKKLGVVNVAYVADGTTDVQIGIDKGGKIVCKNGTFSIPAAGLTNLTSYEVTEAPINSLRIVPSEGTIEFEVSVYKLYRLLGFDATGNVNTKLIVKDASELKFIGTQLQTSLTKQFNIPDASFGGVLSFKDSDFWEECSRITILNDGARTFTANINEIVSDTVTNFAITNNMAELNIEENNMPNLTSLNLRRCPYIYGDLKVWAEKVWNNGNGRISGSCRILTVDGAWNYTKLTWNGVKISSALSGVDSPYILFHQNEAPTLSASNS